MVDYRRVRVVNSSYFFTVNLRNRQSKILTQHIDLLRKSFIETRIKYPFTIDAVVILPEHIHTIWTLPPNDDNYPTRWQLLKSLFTRKLVKVGINLNKSPKGEYNLWQRRYWEHVIRDEADMQRHIEYIHYNPVKHGLVEQVKDWPHSSFHRYVEAGLVELDWGLTFQEHTEQKFGERIPDSASSIRATNLNHP